MASLQFLLCLATTLLIVNALELTPQLLNAAANEQASNKAKTQYTPFPLVENDVEVEAVELPLDVEQDQENVEQLPQPTRSHHSLPPSWLQFAEDPVQKPRTNNNKATFTKLPLIAQQHKHSHGHGHNGGHGASCTIEITSKVPGVCQPMGNLGMGSACIYGEFMEFYSASHCSNF